MNQPTKAKYGRNRNDSGYDDQGYWHTNVRLSGGNRFLGERPKPPAPWAGLLDFLVGVLIKVREISTNRARRRERWFVLPSVIVGFCASRLKASGWFWQESSALPWLVDSARA